MPNAFTREDLVRLSPEHDSFVGIDSDGCVFNTMEVKQKNCFHGLIVSHWRLEPIEQYARETAEFVSLYSKHRGKNRFLSIIETFDLLGERREVRASGVPLPQLKSLREFVASGLPLSNHSLEEQALKNQDAELADILVWSKAVNSAIAEKASNSPPFKWAVKSLEKIKAHSDAICVSQTPAEALLREWRQHGLMGCVKAIAGQELGTKAEHLRLSADGKYRRGRILMIGDAPGDLEAASALECHFFPIKPGQEEESWMLFFEEAYSRFLEGDYAGDYEAELIAEFNRMLPDIPPW